LPNKKGLSKLIWLVPLSFVALLAILYQGLSNDPRELPSALVGKPLPEFALKTLAGQEMSQQNIVGPALLNVWATWCPTCREEHEYLNTLKAEGVVIYGLNYKDDLTAAKQWLVDLGTPYQFTLADADGQVGIDLGVYGAPETFLINARGEILLRHAGEMNETVWCEKLEPIYKQLDEVET
jgi:cytochrome c biogenesis protein CcmG/thiol:disulfide interchange protein DsbE